VNLASEAPRKKGGQIYLLFGLVLVCAVVAAGWFYMRDRTAPSLTLTPSQGVVGASSSVQVAAEDTASGIRSLTVSMTRSGRTTVLLDKTYPDKPGAVSESIDLAAAELKDGTFEISAAATDGSIFNFGAGNKARASAELRYDSKPPSVSVASGTIYVKRGGTGVVAYTLSEPVQRTGVFVGDVFFPAYKRADGVYVCYYAFPYYVEFKDFAPAIEAEDLAGNERRRKLSLQPKDHEFRHDVINLPDSFLDSKMPDFEGIVPGEMTNLERFLKVNREVRKDNRAALIGIGRKTADLPLWQGAFQRMAGAPRAGFGDQRSYRYDGKEVDRQTHLGVDIASLQHYPVPAANDGVVVFADFMGIYGNCVIIDHGQGLQTLYAHLSEIGVALGETVAKGQIIGKTGVTGMAGGDHLHFGVLVSGIPVSPVEWWDAGWIRDNVTSKLP
jgi:murein DD-endopeptidase MepM/ murein hydrolase activator NlpD